jgi:hypothetical protein
MNSEIDTGAPELRAKVAALEFVLQYMLTGIFADLPPGDARAILDGMVARARDALPIPPAGADGWSPPKAEHAALAQVAVEQLAVNVRLGLIEMDTRARR